MAGIQLSVTVRGQLVRKGLQDLANEDMPKIGRQGIRAMMERVKRRMQEYPPEPPGQSIMTEHPVLGKTYRTAPGRYHRTGLLGHSWFIEDLGNDKGYVLKNDAARKGRPYAIYVVGNAYGLRQAWMHKGRWQLMRSVTEDEIGKMVPEIKQNISTAARRKGF